MNRVQLAAVVLAVLGAGVAGGYWWGQRAPDAPSSATPATEKQALYWYDPMVPDQHFDKPGKSPFMDMQLVPKYADRSEEHTSELQSLMRISYAVFCLKKKK